MTVDKARFDKEGKYIPDHYLLKIDGFGGVRVSDYAEEKGKVDYFTLSECIRYIYNYKCINSIDDWEYSNTDMDDWYDWCLISDDAYDFLKKHNEAVASSSSTNLYLWGIPCIGKSWKLELTSIDFNDEQVTEI